MDSYLLKKSSFQMLFQKLFVRVCSDSYNFKHNFLKINFFNFGLNEKTIRKGKFTIPNWNKIFQKIHLIFEVVNSVWKLDFLQFLWSQNISVAIGNKRSFLIRVTFFWKMIAASPRSKNTGHLEWNLPGYFSEFKINGDSKKAL